ncbi:MAG: AAA family ATPase [Myroides sp.]
MKKTYDIIFNNDSGDKVNNIIKNYFIDGEDEPIKYLPMSNEINIIVGSNNSGKSRFMRYLMSCQNLIGVEDSQGVRESINNYNNILEEFNKQNIMKAENYYRLRQTSYASQYDVDRAKERLDTVQVNRLKAILPTDYSNLFENIEKNRKRINELQSIGIEDDFFINYSEINPDRIKQFNNKKNYYIPTLRSAHALFQQKDDTFSKIENDIFLDTLNRYYALDKKNIEIFTGLHLYKSILNSRNSKRAVRQSFEKFEKFVGENFFGGKQIDIVAEFNKDDSLSGKNYSEVINIHIEGEKETRDLYELGDGIQAIIILMYKIFMAENDSFIFIDEPELNLHPGMQRLFLDQISSNKDLKSKNLIYFISTHSNHLLDLTIEKENVSIYSFSSKSVENEDNTFTLRNVNFGDNTVLKNLGVNNSSVFIANCTIWVEGVSDRNYIKAFLKSYIKSLPKKEQRILKEDIDYAFFEYAGSNIEHYFFDELTTEESDEIISDIKALALSNRIFLLADSDVAKRSSKKGKRLTDLENLSRENFDPYIIWSCREIENLLTKEIWEQVLISLCNKNLVKNHSDEIQTKIKLALEEVNMSSYSKKYIGEFLELISKKLGKIDSQNILNESTYHKSKETFGTLVHKRAMSERVLEEDFSWDVFEKNQEIKELTEAIYKFITVQ